MVLVAAPAFLIVTYADEDAKSAKEVSTRYIRISIDSVQFLEVLTKS